MKKIQLYSDETKPKNKTFLIYSMIYGTSDQIECLNSKIIKLLGPLDSENKGLHSCKLNEKKPNLFVKYEKVLDILQELILKNKIQAKICLIGAEKNGANIRFLKQFLETELNKEGSSFNEAFSGLNTTDYPALFHRIDHLFLYLLYRDRMAHSGTSFELYPDSSGKILRYKSKKFLVNGVSFSGFLEFYALVKLIGNLIASSISKLKISGWSSSDQNISKYEPLKSTESYIIQVCDILSNFFYCFLRHKVGVKDEKYKLKANALINRFDFDEIDEILAKFEKRDEDVSCTDLKCIYTIDLESLLTEKKE